MPHGEWQLEEDEAEFGGGRTGERRTSRQGQSVLTKRTGEHRCAALTLGGGGPSYWALTFYGISSVPESAVRGERQTSHHLVTYELASILLCFRCCL